MDKISSSFGFSPVVSVSNTIYSPVLSSSNKKSTMKVQTASEYRKANPKKFAEKKKEEKKES